MLILLIDLLYNSDCNNEFTKKKFLNVIRQLYNNYTTYKKYLIS